MFVCLFFNNEPPRTPPLEGASPHRRNASLFTTCFQLRVDSPCQMLWHRHVTSCKAGRFSYGKSPRTPPLEGTSLHRWNISVERPLGILSLFTTRFQLRVNSPCQMLWHRHVTSCEAGRFSYGESPRTPPLEGTSLHRWNISVERPWGILSLFTTFLRQRVHSPSKNTMTQTCGIIVKQVGFFFFFFLRRITADPSFEGISLHRWNMNVERPSGILSLLTTSLRWRVNSPCLILFVFVKQAGFVTANHRPPPPTPRFVWWEPEGGGEGTGPVHDQSPFQANSSC